MQTIQAARPELASQDQRPAGGLPSQLGPRSPRRTPLEGGRSKVKVDQRIAQGLGWFSIALSLMQLLAPRQLGRAIGVGDHPALMRGLGLRELGAGIGILTQPHRPAWLWSRVAGDAMDLALLGTALATASRGRGNLAIAVGAVAGVTALDVYAAREMGRHYHTMPGNTRADGSIRVEDGIAVNRTPEDSYRTWQAGDAAR